MTWYIHRIRLEQAGSPTLFGETHTEAEAEQWIQSVSADDSYRRDASNIVYEPRTNVIWLSNARDQLDGYQIAAVRQYALDARRQLGLATETLERTFTDPDRAIRVVPLDVDSPGSTSGSAASTRRWKPWAFGLLVLAVAAAVVVFILHSRGLSQPPREARPVPTGVRPDATPLPTGTPTAPASARPSEAPTPPGSGAISGPDAVTAVGDYFDAVNAHDYQRAYTSFGSGWRASHPYPGFAAGFSDTVADRIEGESYGPPAQNGSRNVYVTFSALHTDGSEVGYSCTYAIGLEDNSERILDGTCAAH